MKQIKGIWFPDSDTHFEGMIDDEGNYQKMQFDTALKYIKPENRGLFIDVGAHVGLWSRMARKAGFDQILAFESNIENFNCYLSNLRKFLSLSPKIRPIMPWNIGLSDKDEVCKSLTTSEENSGAYYLTEDDNSINIDKNTYSFDNFFKLEKLESEFTFTKQILIKIDVQGYEAKVVRGMTNFIKEYKPIIIVEQWLNGKEDLEATHYCESLGMKILEKVQKEVILGWQIN